MKVFQHDFSTGKKDVLGMVSVNNKEKGTQRESVHTWM